MAKKVYINTEAAAADSDSIIKYIDSDRSDGKTTDLIRRAYDRYKAVGKVAVICRRWVGEITTLWVNALFTNLKKVRAVGELTAKGSPKKSGVHLYENGEEFAVCIPLTRSGAVKSAFDFATHDYLYIDEYTPLDGRYIYNEVVSILEIYRTIDRDNYATQIWVYSNHTTATNPLFNYFGVVARNGISRWKNGRFLLLRVANKGNRAAVKLSPFGELVDGTSYGEYAAGGTLDNAGRFILPRTGRERLPFSVKVGPSVFGFFYHARGLVVDYVTTTRPGEAVYTIEPTDGAGGAVYMKVNVDLYNALRQRFYMSEVYCATEQVFERFRPAWRFFTGAPLA